MPYRTVEDLPPAVRNALPAHAQEIFLAAFNAAYEGTCNGRSNHEECANRIAWSAVKHKYQKNEQTGEWQALDRKCPPGVFNCTATFTGERSPHAILNVLDTFQRFDDKNLMVWYGTEDFQGTEQAWEKVPVIFAQQHPSGSLLNENQTAALASVKTHDGKPGRIVGNLSAVQIMNEGQPRLETDFEFSDPEVKRLWKEKKLSLSSSTQSFHSPFPGLPDNFRRLDPGVKPNHVLVFVKGPVDRPGDGGAMFLNSKQELPPNPGQNTMERPMSDDKQGESPIELRLKEMEQEIRKMHSVRAQDLADLQDRDEKLKLIELERKQANWDRLAKALPRGWVHGAQEEKSRQEFESNPTEFVLKLVDELNQSHKLAMEKAGEEFQRKSVNPPGKLADVCTGLRVNGKAVGES